MFIADLLLLLENEFLTVKHNNVFGLTKRRQFSRKRTGTVYLLPYYPTL